MDNLDLEEMMEYKELLELQGLQVFLALKGLQDHLDSRVQLVLKVDQAHRETQVLQDPQDHWAHLDNKDRVDRQDSLGQQGNQGLMVNLETEDLLVV